MANASSARHDIDVTQNGRAKRRSSQKYSNAIAVTGRCSNSVDVYPAQERTVQRWCWAQLARTTSKSAARGCQSDATRKIANLPMRVQHRAQVPLQRGRILPRVGSVWVAWANLQMDRVVGSAGRRPRSRATCPLSRSVVVSCAAYDEAAERGS